MTACRSCGAPVLWGRTVAGRAMPMEVPEVEPAPRVVAFHRRTGGARVLSGADMADVERWAAAGVTFHEAHWATCPHGPAWRRAKNLALGD